MNVKRHRVIVQMDSNLYLTFEWLMKTKVLLLIIQQVSGSNLGPGTSDLSLDFCGSIRRG
jgi:hypothetical protein